MARTTKKDAPKTNGKTVSNKSKKIQKTTVKKAAKGVKNGKANGSGAQGLVRQPKFNQQYLDRLVASIRKGADKRYDEIRAKMLKVIKQKGLAESFYVLDMDSVHRRIDLWKHLLPRVEVFFAAKALDDAEVFKAVVSRGCGFDVASEQEMAKVMKNGGKPDQMIFANPCKDVWQIQQAKKKHLKRMTFDSIEELHKIKANFPEAECVVRIAVKVTNATYNLSEKFGVTMEEIPEILKVGKKINLKIVGVAFHVGSGGVTFDSYKVSILNARKIFDMSEKMGMKMNFLDIGGGFTMINPDPASNFTGVATQIGDFLDKVFPEDGVRIIAEPGRYIGESALHLFSKVFSKKSMPDGHQHYYVNNGIYQGYYIRLFDEECLMDPVDKSLMKTRKMYKTTMWG